MLKTSSNFTLGAIGSLALCGALQAQSIWTNPITGSNPSSTNPYTTGQTVAQNITVSGIGRGSGVSANVGDNRYNLTSWNTTAFDANDYFTFSITPAANYEVDFASFVYTGQRSGSGPSNFAFRASPSNFGTNIGTPAATGATIDLSSLQAVTTRTEFRFYAWGGASGGTYSVNDFTFNGTVSLRSAGTLTWDGGRGNGNWDSYDGTAANQSNWNLNNLPSASIVDSLSFAGSTQTTTTNNIANLTVGSINFAANAGAFTNSGNTVTLNGDVANNSSNLQTISHGLTLSSGTHRFNANTANLAVGGVVGGSGAIEKTGTNRLTMSGNNTFSGGLVIVNGTVVAAHNKALGSGNVEIRGSSRLEVNSGITLDLGGSNRIRMTSEEALYQKTFAAGANFNTANALLSDLTVGGVDTTAALRAGVASAGLSAQFGFSAASGETLSNILSLSGMDGEAFALSLTVGAGILDSTSALGWFDSVDGWQLAVDGNHSMGSLAGDYRGYEGSFANFQSTVIGAGSLANYVGAYGVDTTTGEAWAILDHNSDFAIIQAVPEPGTVGLISTGLLFLAMRRRSRKA